MAQFRFLEFPNTTGVSMCRFIAYTGEPILMDELLYAPNNSLILQSYKAKEREEPLNGDGFGVGWYTPEVDPFPGVFKSITPAWSNQNLRHLATKIRSRCFFAHVRAATHGIPVMEVNCHPFMAGRLLWMHNGQVGGFPLLKRKLINLLSEDRYATIQGTTDSEHAFALFLDFLGKREGTATLYQMKIAMHKTLVALERLSRDNKIAETSFLNFCVSNGDDLIAVRYVSDPSKNPASLYCSEEGSYRLIDGEPRLVDTVTSDRAVIVASERLTDRPKDWNVIPQNHLVMIDRNLTVKTEPLT